MKRLHEAAKALDLDIGATHKQLLQMIYNTVDANGMAAASGVHIRLMISRGVKSTPYQNPKVTMGKPTIVILPEWKEAAPGQFERRGCENCALTYGVFVWDCCQVACTYA